MKHRYILPQETSRLLIAVADIVRVVIPAELTRRSVRLKIFDHTFLALRQSIESHEHIPPRQIDPSTSVLDILGRRTVHHTRIDLPGICETLTQSVINGSQSLPDREELALLLRKRFFILEMAPEGTYDTPHLWRQIRQVGLQHLQVVDVAEEHVGIDHIFVDQIEIPEQHLAPEVELVKRLIVIFGVDLVEVGYHTHLFAHGERRGLAHNVVHRHVLRAPQRFIRQVRQLLRKEQTSTYRRQHNRQRRDVAAISVVEAFCRFGKESGLHGRLFCHEVSKITAIGQPRQRVYFNPQTDGSVNRTTAFPTARYVLYAGTRRVKVP